MEYLKLCDSDYRFMTVVWDYSPDQFRRAGGSLPEGAGLEKVYDLYDDKEAV